MARALQDILNELDASYNPQRQSIQSQINALPAQADAQIAGLQGQQDQAFKDILSGAQDRGLGFSGIPLGEQAKYTSSQFLPAVARVKESQNSQRTSLTDALNNINLDQNKYAQTLRQAELDREQARAQFEQQLAAQRAAAAAAAFSPTYSPTGGDNQSTTPPKTDPLQQIAYNDVATRISKQSDKDLISDFLATQKSATYGNPKDKFKIAIYTSLRPDLFAAPSANYLGRLSASQTAKQSVPKSAPKPFQAPNLLRGLPL